MKVVNISSVPRFQLGHPRVASANTKEFPPFRLDSVNQCLWRRGDGCADERILLKPKSFAVLRYLVDHAGRLVTQDELLDAVWPDTHVQPEVLKRHIFDIRDVLGDDSKSPKYIETQSRRGYQFVAPVRNTASEETAAAISTQTTLVGRDAALSELRACLGKAVRGQRQIVFVTGEPGIGKTTLVDEFQRQALQLSGIRVARAQCVECCGSKETYYPVLEAVGNLCRGPEGDHVVQILAAYAPTWLIQVPALVKREQREVLQREIQGATQQRMLREIGDAIEALAAERPLLLVLEDLHWTDHSTVDLISALARGRSAAKLMVVGTFRPADVALSEHPLRTLKQDLSVHGLVSELVLKPLAEWEITAYLAGESPDAYVPNELVALVHRHSDGNPLFMVAVLDHMVQRGLVAQEREKWEFRVPAEEIAIEVPENLQAMIELQIERMSPEEQRVLEVGCVNGVAFSATVNAGLAGVDEEKFEGLCEEMSRRHHVVRRAGLRHLPDGNVSPRYQFVHALYREVIYRRQSPRRRAKLHLQVGERLESLYGERSGEVAHELVHHFEEAGDEVRVKRYQQLADDTRRSEPKPVMEIRESHRFQRGRRSTTLPFVARSGC